MRAEGQTDFERAVARAMTSPFGIGRARFHLGGDAGPADTVYLGIFRREVIERLGGYDEHFARAQDWELNHRIRATGETVWFTPDLEVTYRPRGSLGGTRIDSSSGAENGAARWSASTRAPPVFGTWRPRVATVALAIGTAAGLGSVLGGPAWLAVGWLIPSAYVGGVFVAGLAAGRGLPWRSRMWLPVVLATMHTTWGTGFLVGHRHAARRPPRSGRDRRMVLTCAFSCSLSHRWRVTPGSFARRPRWLRRAMRSTSSAVTCPPISSHHQS